MNRTLPLTLVLLVLAACGGKVATPAGQECSETLRLAEKEYEAANTESVSGGIEMMKATNLISQAAVAKQFEKFTSCTDKARRARIYIQEATKK